MTNIDDVVLPESEIGVSETPSFSNMEQSQLQEQSLRGFVESTMENYFRYLDDQSVTDVYSMVLAEIEAPLLEVVMRNTRQNQTKASRILGLNRGTLRKKLKRYGLL